MITQLTAAEISEKLAKKEMSAVEVASAFLDRIESEDAKYGAFLTVDRERALEQARNAQARIEDGSATPLTGVPIAVKDNISTEGIETTCASKILKGYVPPYDATVVQKLKESGAVILGKTNLDEFAMGSSTETSAYQLSRNPWDTERTPGGSSGGSAVAVSADFAPLALGSDTGGSIRLPASFTNTVGFKPTYGRCSRYGLVAFASSLDQIGPMSKTVEDAAELAKVITGHCKYDATSIPARPIDTTDLKNGSLKGKKLAFPKEMYGEGTDPAVRDVIESSLEVLRKEGAIIDEISISTIPLGVTTYYIIAPAEASSNLGRYDGVRYGVRSEGQGHIDVVAKSRAQGFGHEVKSRIMIGTYALSAGYYDAFYLKAQQVRGVMTDQFMDAFKEYDFVISPTAPVTAFKLGELSQDPMAMKLLDYCTIPANMGGMPAISIPVGFAAGLPVGLHLMAAPMQDEALLSVSYAIESVFQMASNRPPIA
jgi:aspartyl-tRNA(Asn)/glutamyl-tRNA(Gln) amidotransferase subunit A